MSKFREWLEKKEINEAQNKNMGEVYETDKNILFGGYEEKLKIAEKIFKEMEKNPKEVLVEYNKNFKEIPPKSIKFLGANLGLHSGFIDAHIDFLLEIEQQDGKTIKESIRYSLDKKKFLK